VREKGTGREGDWVVGARVEEEVERGRVGWEWAMAASRRESLLVAGSLLKAATRVRL
jgi:hypothetical protein